MKTTLWTAGALLLFAAGGALFVRGVVPFVRDFGALKTAGEDLLPRIVNLLGGLLSLAGARIAFQMSRAKR